MKRFTLTLLFSSLLAACSDSSDSNDITPTPTPAPEIITGVLMDAQPVQGARVLCDNALPVTTNALGQFEVAVGANCEFALGEFNLGRNQAGITSEQSVITTYQLSPTSVARSASSAESNQEVANISALLQSVDINKSDDMIDVTQVDDSSIPAGLLSAATDDEFNRLMQDVKVFDGEGVAHSIVAAGGELVSPTEAIAELNQQYYSEHVQSMVDDLTEVLSGDMSSIDIEAKLATYRGWLEAQEDSNGYHQQAVLAILAVMEVVNMEQIALRVDITGTNYSEMLAKALDMPINPQAKIEFVSETALGTTEDVNQVFTNAADKLVAASKQLAQAMPGEGYVLTYTDKAYTYQDSLVLRSASLLAADALYTLAAYQLGKDENYLPQSSEMQLDVVQETQTYYHGDDKSQTIRKPVTMDFTEVEYEAFSYDPKSVVEDENLLLFAENAEQLLSKAKLALVEAVLVAKQIDLPRYLDDDEANELANYIADLDRHLADSTSYFTYQDGDNVIYANLHLFYQPETGIDRSDLVITVSDYTCEAEDLSLASYDESLSQLFSEPTCDYQGDYMMDEEYRNWQVTKEIMYSYENILDEAGEVIGSKYESVFVPAVDADFDLKLTEATDSNAIDVVWCGNDATGAKQSCFQ